MHMAAQIAAHIVHPSVVLWYATRGVGIVVYRRREHPLPRRVTPAYMQAAVPPLSRAAQARNLAGNRAQAGLAGALREVAILQDACASLVQAAHAAGVCTPLVS